MGADLENLNDVDDKTPENTADYVFEYDMLKEASDPIPPKKKQKQMVKVAHNRNRFVQN